MMNEKEQLWYTRFLNYANRGMPRTHWCHETGSRSEKKRDPAHKADHVKANFVMHQKQSKKETVMLLLPISTKRSPIPTGFLPLNEIAIWLKSHRRNGCGYEKKKRFLFWMNISSGSEASIRTTSSKESSAMESFTARTRSRLYVHSCST